MSIKTLLGVIAELEEVLVEKSYREGDFTLTSGRKSKYYVDAKVTVLSHKGAELTAKAFAEILRSSKGSEKIGAVAGVELGAVTMARDLARELGCETLLIRKKPKGHGTGKQIEGMENVPVRSAVVLVEDVVTTGGTTVHVGAKALEEAGYNVFMILSVVDREEGGRKFIEESGYSFDSLTTRTSLSRRKFQS